MKTLLFIILFSVSFQSKAQITIAMQTNYHCPECNYEFENLLYEQPASCPQCGLNMLQKERDAELAMARNEKKLSVCFYLQDGVEVLDFAGPMEVFALAGFKVFTVSKTKKPILAQGILKIIPDYDITNAPSADMLVFFGGHPSQFRDRELIEWIKKYEKNVDYLFSVCSGAFALGLADLLNGQTATTFHARIQELRDAVPGATVLEGVRFVDNGRVVTTAGISAGIDGALHMVARLRGEEAARAVAVEMEYDKWIPNEGLIREK
jgi:transcriptional regulator GlxA family with amidase domain